jgi:23S rRNA (cytidine1920-2'-O)/16S rRNA (cytidine1409-2'-O)-methyltransferase
MAKKRIDILLTERGLVDSRAKAQRLVMAGQVRSNGELVNKPAEKVEEHAQIKIIQKSRYVSRGADKLVAAVKGFELNIKGTVCADVGSSTGGFTDCLLQNGAEKVFAIDVGKGILAWKLRQDPRVVVMEGTNARYVEKLDQEVDLVTIDVSFISLKNILPVAKHWFGGESGEVVALIKPQFEAGRKLVSKGKGVIRDPQVHRQVLIDLLEFSAAGGYSVLGLIKSPVLGPKGNAEFLVHLRVGGKQAGDIMGMINGLIPAEEETE